MDWWYTPTNGANCDSEQPCFHVFHSSQTYFSETDFSDLNCYKIPTSWSNNERTNSASSCNQNCVYEAVFSDFNHNESAPNFYPPQTLDGSLPSSEELMICENLPPPYLEECTTLNKEYQNVMTSYNQVMEESLEIIKAYKAYKQNELQEQSNEATLEMEDDASAEGHGMNSIQFYESNPLQVEATPIEQEEEEFIPQSPTHHFIDEEYVVEVIKANGEKIILGDILEESDAQRAEELVKRFKEAIVHFDDEQSMLGDIFDELTDQIKPEPVEGVESKASCGLHMMLATILGAKFEKPSSRFFYWNLEKIFPQTVEENFFKIFPYYPP